MHLNFRNMRLFISFDQNEIARCETGQQSPEIRLDRGGGLSGARSGRQVVRFIAQFMHQHPALIGDQHHLGGTGFTMAPGILARPIDIETMMRMLDDRDAQAPGRELRQQVFNQGRLARTGPANDSERANRVSAGRTQLQH